MDATEVSYKKRLLLPKLRFRDFTESWGMQPLIELSINGFSNGAFNDPKKVGSGYRIINVKDMYIDGTIKVDTLTRVAIDEKEFSKNRVEYGDIFFTRSSLVKEGIAYSNVNLNEVDDLTFDGHLIRMRPNRKTHSPVFLYYNFSTKTARMQFIKRGKTATMTTIGQEDIAKVEIIFPTLLEQQKIASFLTAVDEKLQTLKKKKTLLEQYKKGVMQKIFSQELRFKDDKGKAFPKWENKKLGEVALKIGDGLHGTPIYSDSSDIYFINGNNLINGKIEITESTKKVAIDIFAKNNKSLNQNTLLISINGTIGNIAKYKNEKVMLGKSVGYFNFKENTDFFYYVLNSEIIQNNFISELTGSTIKNLSLKTLRETEILLPSLSEQTKIANFLSAIDDKINYCKIQIEKTEQYKKGLLQNMLC